MARPRKGQEMGATERVAFRITPAVLAALQARAERNGRLISDEVREAIERHLGLRPEPERPRRALPPDPKPMRPD